VVLDEVKDERFDVVPVGGLFFGYRYEIFPVKYTVDSWHLEQPSSQGRHFIGILEGGDVDWLSGPHDEFASGNKLEEMWVGSVLGPDEEGEGDSVNKPHN
jgi:hypothetical protein